MVFSSSFSPATQYVFKTTVLTQYNDKCIFIKRFNINLMENKCYKIKKHDCITVKYCVFKCHLSLRFSTAMGHIIH